MRLGQKCLSPPASISCAVREELADAVRTRHLAGENCKYNGRNNRNEKILQLMELIGNSGTTTMLHVTHDPSEVLECEKHILELCPDEDPMYRCLQA